MILLFLVMLLHYNRDQLAVSGGYQWSKLYVADCETKIFSCFSIICTACLCVLWPKLFSPKPYTFLQSKSKYF